MIAYNDKCTCITPGEDDGDTTCWPHHDCSAGVCTHAEEIEDDDIGAVDREEDCSI